MLLGLYVRKSEETPVPYLNLLFNVSLQLLNLLDEGLLASGELRDESFFLFKLTTKLAYS